jgi:hypothetical protein
MCSNRGVTMAQVEATSRSQKLYRPPQHSSSQRQSSQKQDERHADNSEPAIKIASEASSLLGAEPCCPHLDLLHGLAISKGIIRTASRKLHHWPVPSNRSPLSISIHEVIHFQIILRTTLMSR